MQARQNLNILSADNSSLVENTYKSWSMVGNSSTYAFNHRVKDQTLEFGTTLTGAMLSGDTVELVAGGNVHVVGATIVGPHGTSVLGGGWVVIEAGLENHTSTYAHQESGHGYGVVKTDGRVHYVGANENQEKQNQSATSVTPVLTTIDSAEGAVIISGGQDVTLQGTKIDALLDVNLSAGNRLILGGIYSGESSSDEQEKGTFICKMRDGTGLEMQTWTVVPGSIQAGGNLRLSAGQEVELGAVNLQTGGAVVFNTPEVKFVGEKNSDYLSHKAWDRDRGYEVNKGNGHVDETLTLTRTTIDARGGIQLPASTRLSVAFDEHVLRLASAGTPVTAEQFKTLANQLAQEPGMAYLADLAKRPDIDWQAVSTAHQQWDYKGQGLTQAGAIVLTVVVAIVAAPASGWVNTAAAGATGSAAVGAAAGAGFTTLATSAAVSLANNGGDIGKTLHDLGSDETMKSLATSMATAGLVNAEIFESGGKMVSMSQLANVQTIPGLGSSAGSVSWNNLGRTALGITGRSIVTAGVSTTINGGSFENAFKQSLVSDLAAVGANYIGTTWGGGSTNKNPFLQTLAHAGLGCASAAATSKDCAAGAIGGASESVLGNLVDQFGGLRTEANGQYSPLTRGFYTGGALIFADIIADAAGLDAPTAMNAALNAATNNYLDHRPRYKGALSEKEQYENAVAACKPSNPEACQLRDALVTKSRERDIDLQNACSGNTPDFCNVKAREAIAMGNIVYGSNGDFVYANSPQPGAIRYLNPVVLKAPDRAPGFDTELAPFMADAALMVGGDILLKYGTKGISWFRSSIVDGLESSAGGTGKLSSYESSLSRINAEGEMFANAGTGSELKLGANNTVTAYRVEGIPNQRFVISETGEVSLVPNKDQMVWVNFGQGGRATQYLETKIGQGLPGAELKSFEVDASFLERVRADAVAEKFARQNPGKPVISRDPYPDQFGIPKTYFDDFTKSIKPGTGKSGQ